MLSDLFGKSIEEFWNDIYDKFDWCGTMIVERLDGKEFNIQQVRTIFKDLLENMSEDFCLIDTEIVSLKKIKFINLYDDHLDSIKSSDWEVITRDLCKDNFEFAIDTFKELKSKKIIGNFKITTKEFHKNKPLKYVLTEFYKARRDDEYSMWHLNNILEKIEAMGLKNKLLKSCKIGNKTYGRITKFFNEYGMKGSRHEGKSEANTLKNLIEKNTKNTKVLLKI